MNFKKNIDNLLNKYSLRNSRVFLIDNIETVVAQNLKTKLFKILESDDDCLLLQAIAIIPTVPLKTINPSANDFLEYFLNGEATLYKTNTTLKLDANCICSIQPFKATINPIVQTPIVLSYQATTSCNASNNTNDPSNVVSNTFQILVYNPNNVPLTYSLIEPITTPGVSCNLEINSLTGVVTIDECGICSGTYTFNILVSGPNGPIQTTTNQLIVDNIYITGFTLNKNNVTVDSDVFPNGVFHFDAFDLSNNIQNPSYTLDIPLNDALGFYNLSLNSINSSNPNFTINSASIDTSVQPNVLRVNFSLLGRSGESRFNFVVENSVGLTSSLSFNVSVSNTYP